MTTTAMPGPDGHWLLGSVQQFQRDKLGFLTECANIYGDVFQFRAGPTRIVVVNDVAEVRKILIDDAANYQKSRLTRDIFGRIMGNGLMISEGEHHRRQRRLAQPAFDAKRLRAYGDVAVRHAEAASKRWESSNEIEVQSEMTRITLGIAAEALFGAAIDADSVRIVSAVERLQEAGAALFNSGFVPPAWVPTRKNRMLKRAVAEVDEVLGRVIRERRKQPEDRGDLLSMLLLARDEAGEPMSPEQVRDEALTLFLSGFETTANALTWTWYFAAKNAEVQARMAHQVSSVLGDRTATHDDLAALPYVSMVLKESLRVCCPIWAFNRSPIASLAIKGHVIRPKDVVIISPYLLHQNAAVFPQPEHFDPERFDPEREAKIPRMAFLPFGAGPRICIGARLAMLEAELVIATLVRRFRLLLPDGYRAEPEVLLSIRPKGGLTMRVETRV